LPAALGLGAGEKFYPKSIPSQVGLGKGAGRPYIYGRGRPMIQETLAAPPSLTRV
jgi:hypothetical protein